MKKFVIKSSNRVEPIAQLFISKANWDKMNENQLEFVINKFLAKNNANIRINIKQGDIVYRRKVDNEQVIFTTNKGDVLVEYRTNNSSFDIEEVTQ